MLITCGECGQDTEDYDPDRVVVLVEDDGNTWVTVICRPCEGRTEN